MPRLVPEQEGEQAAQGPRLVPVDRQQKPQREPMSPGEIASGIGQTALTIGTGAIAEPIAGITGLIRGGTGLLTGEEDILQNMTDAIEGTQDTLTIGPFNESGERVAETVAVPFQWLQKQARRGGEATLEATGSPAAATGVQTGIEMIPAALGVPGRRGVPRSELREATRFAREEGINIRRRGEQLREEVAGAGTRRADAERGRGAEEMRNAVERAREQAKAQVDDLYNQARAKRAGVEVDQALEFPDVVRQSLADFDVEDMPKVRRRLQEIERLRDLPPNSQVTLKAIDNWRKRINKNRSTDASENRALDIMKGQLDTWLDTKFNTDMISGDPEALAAWKRARQATQTYKENFSTDKAIAQFRRQDATPEEIRQWIFGASSVGAKKQAGQTVNRLKKIVGEESPEFTALRSDALFDVMRPLMQEQPNLKGFMDRYDRMVSENPTLTKELFGDSAKKELENLRRFAASARKAGDPPDTSGLFRRALAVFTLGHGIARGALRVSGAQKVMQAFEGAGNKRRFLENMFDDPIDSPMLGRVMRAGAVAQGGQQLSQEEGGIDPKAQAGRPASTAMQ